jgi:RNA polymerase sigma-70 factor, ECF subfamily
MQLDEHQILKHLMENRVRISAAAWLVVKDAHAAEDIFQNVALKAITRKVEFQARPALMSWAFITARREGIDWLRRHRRMSTGLDDELMDLLDLEWGRASSGGPQAGARMEALSTCLESLPEKSKNLLNLRYHDGYNCIEIAKRIGIDLNAVYKRLSRLHQGLRHCIDHKIEKVHSA